MNLHIDLLKDLVERNGGEKLFLEENKTYFSNLIANQFNQDERTKRLFQLAIKEGICFNLIKLKPLNESNRLLEIESIKHNFVDLNGLSYKSATVVDLFAEVLFSLPTEVDNEALEWIDIYGVIYSSDRTELIKGKRDLIEYEIIPECRIICDNAFQYCFNLQKINIPKGIIKIGDEAFMSCDLLQEIIIPDSVRFIGNMAFSGCSHLQNIIANSPHFKSIDGVLFTADLKTIIAFPKKNEIDKYKIPDSVTTIGKNAFNCCVLKSIHISNSVTTIEDLAFAWSIFQSIYADSNYYKSKNNILYSADFKTIIYHSCINEEGLTESSLEIPDDVVSIAKFAFSGSLIKRIYMPDSLITIENNAFSFCHVLETVFISDSVITIGNSAFSECIKLQFIYIPEGVTTIGDSVFSDCKSLKSIHIPESITCIGNDIFNSCPLLTQIHIPEGSITKFQSLFKEDYHKFLKEDIDEEYSTAQFPSNEGSWKDEYGLLYTANKKKLISVPHFVSKYTINPECKVICDFAFNTDENIYIPDSIILIGEEAFGGTTLFLKNIFANSPYFQSIDGVLFTADLKTIVKFPGSKRLIADLKTNIKFQGKEYQDEYEIPYGVTTIGKYAFNGCIGLQAIYISKTVDCIDFLGLNGCHTLKNIYANNSYFKSIDGILFSSDLMEIITFPSGKDITDYNILDGVTSIGFHAFTFCSNLQSVYIPSSIKSIGIMAFYGCNKLQDIHIDNNYFKSIGGVLYSADLKTIIKYPEGKTATEYIIVNGVTTINGFAFSDCVHLKIIQIPDSAISIDEMAFYNTEFQTIYIPKGSKEKFKNRLKNKYHKSLKEKSELNENSPFLQKFISLFQQNSSKKSNG